MNIPKKIHYFWAGNNIPEQLLKNMISVKRKNPNFEVNVWGNDNIKSLINNTLNKIKFKYQGNGFDIGEIFFNFTYKNIEIAFNHLFRQAHFQRLVPDEKTNCLRFFNRNHERENIQQRLYSNYEELAHYLKHVYFININGNCHNYASASDIARLVILYMEGGIYLDADVELNDIKTEKDKLAYLKLKSDIGLGDCNGEGWNIKHSSDTIGNAIVSSLPNSKKVFDILIKMAITIKRHHLYTQINQPPTFDKIRNITGRNRKKQIDNRIDFALKLKERKEINLDEKCNIMNPIWRTGIPRDSEKEKINDFQRGTNRINYTMELTGPSFLTRVLGPENKNHLPKRYKLMSTNKHDNIFQDVDASGTWADIHKKKYSN
ncbi:hypothetical protein FE394_05485 [Xenorhabdus sp. Reich]|uniref:Subversion of eukaryotic traffic protein A n=1 Tax=Xenorhabdus littoralis TaxID=2582835 RepID=A0ABU4SJC3_9GAMM|nr:glycosyltransferase [Xenorhabdus sp. Reich]MDX7998655.1 hypothetical protein [Xenorhabdus sp. Reich]